MNAMANQRLAGKVAYITGGASGVGKATALRLAGEGANVVVSDVNEEGGRAVAAEIGAQSCFVQHDVTDEAQWSVAIAAAQQVPLTEKRGDVGGERHGAEVARP